MGNLTKYFLLTYAITWICFISVALLSHGTLAKSGGSVLLQQVLLYMGTITPSIIAIALTLRSGKTGETQILLSRIIKWRVNIKWYVFAISYIVVIKLLVALVIRVTTGAWPLFGNQSWYMIAVVIIFFMWIQAGEEIGWRGFALPRMTERLGLSASTLLLGMLWAFWHLPLFFVQGADNSGKSFLLFLFQVTGLSIAMGWLYWRTRGSLLLVMLMHAATNNTKDIVPSVVPGSPYAVSNHLVAWLTVILLWICGIYFLIQMRNVRSLE